KDRPPSRRESAYHFTLLAENETGYRNLVKLVTAAHLDGFHYAPRIDKEMLAARSEGLIGLSGCLAGEINSAIQANNIEKAKQSAAEYRDILGAENFFIELHDHGMEQKRMHRSAAANCAGNLCRNGRGQRCSFSAPERPPGARRHALHRHGQNGA